MSWFKWRRVGSEGPPSPPPVVEPEPPRTSFLEKLAKWQRIFRERQQAEPSHEALERARAQQRRTRLEAEEDRIAAIVAQQGCFFPGDEVDLPRAGAPPGMIRAFGLETWAAQAEAMDWRRDVDARQAEEIRNGGRG
jgi:hypothetical protein